MRRPLDAERATGVAPTLLCHILYHILMIPAKGAAGSNLVKPMDGHEKPKLPPLHIGQRIKEELERQERTVSWFARKLYCDRSNVYKLFKRSAIDTELLLRISVILNHDFFEEYVARIADKTTQTQPQN